MLTSLFDQLQNGQIRLRDYNPNLIDLVLEAGLVGERASSARFSFVYGLYLNKLAGPADNSTDMDPLAALGFPALIVSRHTPQHSLGCCESLICALY